jgi:hypothetical protein
MSKMTKQDLHEEICTGLTYLSRLFVPGMKLTFIARLPGNGEADVLVSDDQMDEIIKLVQRRQAASGSDK